MRKTLRRPDHKAGIRQLTGKDLKVGQTEFTERLPADPFVDFHPSGKVHVYGTFENYLEFNSLDDMLRGAQFKVKRIETDEYLANEASWDHMIHRWDGKEVMYAGVMTSTTGHSRPAWPADNWTRRIYAMTRNSEGKWERHAKPLFGEVRPGQNPTMIGHAYGHHFKTITRTVKGRQIEETWLFHEEVVSEKPMRTEAFARKMLNPYTASDKKVKILGVDIEGKPTLGRRQNSDEYLVEGPRPFEVKIGGETFHFVSLGSSDFNNDNYDLNFAWRKGTGIGEYTPYLETARGGEPKLVGFAESIKERYQLSWVGRAEILKDGRGDHWAIFHGVDKRIRPEVDHSKQHPELGTFQRNLYVVPLRFSMDKSGAPKIELLDQAR